MKQYIQPAIAVIEMEMEQTILDGSDPSVSMGHDFNGNDKSFEQE